MINPTCLPLPCMPMFTTNCPEQQERVRRLCGLATHDHLGSGRAGERIAQRVSSFVNDPEPVLRGVVTTESGKNRILLWDNRTLKSIFLLFILRPLMEAHGVLDASVPLSSGAAVSY